MKQFITVLFFSALGSACFSQTPEFDKSKNGLIYSDTTIEQLKFIVDSLNLKFKVCDLSRTYLSEFQTKANFVFMEKGKIKEAKKDIESNISWEEFIKKYPDVELEKDLLAVRFNYNGYNNESVVKFSCIELGGKYNHDFRFEAKDERYNDPLKGKWVYYYYEKDEYEKESLKALYFIEGFSRIPIPVSYAKMIQYSDCMVDTFTQVFYDKAHESGALIMSEPPANVNELMNYVRFPVEHPVYPLDGNKNELELYEWKYKQWDSVRVSRMDSMHLHDEHFNTLLKNSIKAVMDKGGSEDDFEELVARYHSKEAALELKRNRIVVGGCSQDNAPREHAFNIAILSAETKKWEVFLRSHLDIMNDNFERMSDGSYAWKKRKTYIKELEVLDINVPDLLLGISLKITNASSNHYFGSSWRLGRALAETSNPNVMESKMIQMISDNQLDDYNRIVVYYIFRNYIDHLESKGRQAVARQKLKSAVKLLPEYLASKIESEKWAADN